MTGFETTADPKVRHPTTSIKAVYIMGPLYPRPRQSNGLDPPPDTRLSRRELGHYLNTYIDHLKPNGLVKESTSRSSRERRGRDRACPVAEPCTRPPAVGTACFGSPTRGTGASWTDEVVGHAFQHGYHPQHHERLAAYWGEALGGPSDYSSTYGDESSVVRLHSGNGEHDEMNRRAIACFDGALDDVGFGPRRSRPSRAPRLLRVGDQRVGESVPRVGRRRARRSVDPALDVGRPGALTRVVREARSTSRGFS